jgi:hypothetical protein
MLRRIQTGQFGWNGLRSAAVSVAMRTFGICSAFALALVACEKPAPAASDRAAPGAQAEAPPPPVVPAPAPPARYVGRWAASADLCQTGAWNFAERRLETAGEVACEFQQVTPNEGGYDIHAVCTAEGPPKPYDLKLRFAQSAKALLLEGGPFNDIGLIWCGEGPGPF